MNIPDGAGGRFFASRLRGAGDDAEDVVQEVLANLAKTFQSGRYERAKGSFRAYLGW